MINIFLLERQIKTSLLEARLVVALNIPKSWFLTIPVLTHNTSDQQWRWAMTSPLETRSWSRCRPEYRSVPGAHHGGISAVRLRHFAHTDDSAECLASVAASGCCSPEIPPIIELSDDHCNGRRKPRRQRGANRALAPVQRREQMQKNFPDLELLCGASRVLSRLTTIMLLCWVCHSEMCPKIGDISLWQTFFERTVTLSAHLSTSSRQAKMN